MSASKRNPYFVLGSIVVVTLLMAVAFYLGSRQSEGRRLAGDIKQQHAQNSHANIGQTVNSEDAQGHVAVIPAYPVQGRLAVASLPSTQEISKATVLFRGVDLTKTTTARSEPNHDIAYATVDAVRGSPFFDKNETKPDANIEPKENGTFTFGMTVKLEKPVKL